MREIIRKQRMLRLLMSLCSISEVVGMLFYFFSDCVIEQWVDFAFFGLLVAEPICYYVFAGFIAMRAVSTTADLVSMLLILPPYYLSLLMMSLLRLDMHESIFLNNMVFYDFSQLSQLKQLLLHILLTSIPISALTLINMLLQGFEVLGVLLLCDIGIAVAADLLTISRIRRRFRYLTGASYNRVASSISESDSDATYLDYPPLLALTQNHDRVHL